jgi:hypothetical protein
VAELIGVGRCPIGCGSTKARYTLSAKQLAVGTCNACNCQVFARSDRSDELLRANITPSEPARSASPETAVVAITPADPAPAAPVTKKRIGWGIFAGQEVD